MEIQRIPLEGLKNTRDLGGFPTKDGRHIRPCRLIRSGELFNGTEADMAALTQQYHLKKVLDFRTSKEREEHPDPELPGVVNHHMPLLDEKAPGVTREGQDGDMMEQLLSFLMSSDFDSAGYMAGIYEQIITGAMTQKQYGQMFDELLSQKEGAVLWHCTAGKDRAGIASILILSALDVPESIIEEDYLKVNEFYREDNEKLCDMMEKKTNNHSIRQGILDMFSVHKEYLERVMAVIQRNYGTMEDYLEMVLGLTPDKKAALKQLYLEP